MKVRVFHIVIVGLFLFSLVGCAQVRTYTVEKERVDQNLEQGNSGYFMGKPSEEEIAKNKNRKLTRKTYVAEIELGAPVKKVVKKQAVASKTVETVQEPENEQVIEEVLQEDESSQQAPVAATKEQIVTFYTVLPNDTLENISLKVYGTSKKWKKIFEANADSLKSPNKIYAGQSLKIPQE